MKQNGWTSQIKVKTGQTVDWPPQKQMVAQQRTNPPNKQTSCRVVVLEVLAQEIL
jgi:hypothetical protein